MLFSVAEAQALQLQVDSLSTQFLIAAEVKAYDASWLPGGKKVYREGGKFASSGDTAATDAANTATIKQVTPFVPVPKLTNKTRVAKKVEHFKQIKEDSKALQKSIDDDLEFIGDIETQLRSPTMNKNHKGAVKKSLDGLLNSVVSKLESERKAQRKAEKKLKPLQLSIALDLTIGAAMDIMTTILASPFTLAYAAGVAVGKTGRAAYDAGQAVGKAGRAVYNAGQAVGQAGKQAQQQTQQTTKKIDQLIQDYRDKWEKTRESDTAKQVEAFIKNVTPKVTKQATEAFKQVEESVSNIATAAAPAAPALTTKELKQQFLDLINSGDFDPDFLFFLMSKADICNAALDD